MFFFALIYRALKLFFHYDCQVVQVVLESYEPRQVQSDNSATENPGCQLVEEVLKPEGHASPSTFIFSVIPSWDSIVSDYGGIQLLM
jgi:protein EFR3